MIKSYKGFNADWTCRGYKFEVGGEYKHEGNVKACERGFHACEDPLDVFNYYTPAQSVYAEVEQDGEISRESGDSKVASSVLRVKAAISLADLIKAGVEFRFSRAKPEGPSATGVRGAASATGYGGAASATGVGGAASATGVGGAASATGDGGAASATGVRGAASATGYGGAASATGDGGAASATGVGGAASATGVGGAASATGYGGKAKGMKGAALLLVERDDNYNVIAAAGAVVGKTKGIKPDTWYTLKRGKFVVAKD